MCSVSRRRKFVPRRLVWNLSAALTTDATTPVIVRSKRQRANALRERCITALRTLPPVRAMRSERRTRQMRVMVWTRRRRDSRDRQDGSSMAIKLSSRRRNRSSIALAAAMALWRGEADAAAEREKRRAGADQAPLSATPVTVVPMSARSLRSPRYDGRLEEGGAW